MDEQLLALINLFQQTGEAHHAAFASTNGDDPDWAIWYANYLYDKLPAHLGGVSIHRSDLVYMLKRLELAHKSEAPGADWKRFYARSLLFRYG